MAFRRWMSAAGLLGMVLAAGCGEEAPPTPAAQPRPSVGKFVGVHGTVRVRPWGEQGFRSATSGMLISVGDVVTTAPASWAEIEYGRGMKITIRADSYTAIEALDTTGVIGQVDFEAPAQDPTVLKGGRLRIEGVPNEGRRGVVEVTREGAGTVRQQEGASAVVTDSGRELVLRRDQKVAVDTAGAPAAVTQLLPAPTLLAPVPRAELTYPDPERALTVLTWTPVVDAASYRVRVDADGSFAKPLVDQNVTGQNLPVGPLAAGTYYWDVSSLAPTGEGGFPSGFSAFTIKPAPVRSTGPTLFIDVVERRGPTVRVEGRTEKGARVTINGEEVELDTGGRFREHLLLPGSGGKIVVRAVDGRGGSTERLRDVPAARP